MDLTKLSDSDLLALKAGDLSKVSDEGLMHLKSDTKPAPKKQSETPIADSAKNLAAGFVRGAGSIGATIVAPFDIAKDYVAGKGLSLESNRQRRADMDQALASLGADTDSTLYAVGKLGGEVAGTLGAGGFVGNALARIPLLARAAPNLIQSVRTSGMSAGSAGPVPNALTRISGGAITGGVSAGVVNPDEAGAGMMIGGALPVAAKIAGAAGQAVGAGVRKVVGEASPEVVALAKRAKELGIDIPADRIVNSRPLNAAASALNYVPFSGRAATEQKLAEQLNTAASKLMGQDTPNINLALRRAGQDLGSKFEQTLQANDVKVTMPFIQAVADVFNRAEKELGSDALKAISSQVDEIMAKGSSGVIDGQAAYNIKRTLDRIGKRNGPEAWHALELKGKLMDALNDSLGPTAAKEFATTRQQYGNMLSLEKLAKNGVEGELSVARLANLKNINNEPLQELADIAAQFVKAREGQHGAMQRATAGAATAFLGGAPGFAALVAGGRASNALLKSEAARNALLGMPTGIGINPGVEALGYRAAPVLLTGRQ